MATAAKRLSIFPLPRAILFPRLQLPLHIFEPRYRAMISNAMASDQRIGMIQPSGPGDPPPLFPVGCIGKVSDIEALDDGRFNIVLTGISRFRVVEEMAVTTPFRQVQAVPMSEEQDDTGILSAIERGALEDSARLFAERLGYSVDWAPVRRLDDETFVNSIAQVGPFDTAAKQALLETDSLTDRSELLIQLMQFMGSGQAPGSERMQ